MKKCVSCDEYIQDNAKVCRFCGAKQPSGSIDPKSQAIMYALFGAALGGSYMYLFTDRFLFHWLAVLIGFGIFLGMSAFAFICPAVAGGIGSFVLWIFVCKLIGIIFGYFFWSWFSLLLTIALFIAGVIGIVLYMQNLHERIKEMDGK